MDPLPRGRALALLALVAASIVSIEVLLTRLLSVTTWYGLAFVVLSLAMLGLTRGSLVAADAQSAGTPLGPWLASQLTVMAGGLLVATGVAVCIPVTFGADLSSLASVLLVAGSTAIPLVAGGSVVALAPRSSTRAVNWNVLPRPTPLSTSIVPPMSSTS